MDYVARAQVSSSVPGSFTCNPEDIAGFLEGVTENITLEDNDPLHRLTAVLANLRSSPQRVDMAEIHCEPYKGNYPATTFFQAFDRQCDQAFLTPSEKLANLPRFLEKGVLTLFRKLRLDAQSYMQARQTLIDLYPETNEASFAKFFATKLAGHNTSDQRLTRVAAPKSLSEWFDMVSRVRGNNAPPQRQQDNALPNMSGPFHSIPQRGRTAAAPPSPCRHCGGILKQVNPDGKTYPVQYFSRALRTHERNYTVSELECLAIVESVGKFRVYLMVTRFPPIYLMFGTLPPELTEHLTPYPELDVARRIAHERTQTKHLRDKLTFDKQHEAPHFEPGDLVLVKIYQHPNTVDIARSLKTYGIRIIYKNSSNLLTSLRHPYTKSYAPQIPSILLARSTLSRVSNALPHTFQHTLNTGHPFNTNHPTIHYRNIHNQHQ
ncbi:hypothetical protein LAZ67_16002051 [Cordylochernes scorpioides]|uniref:Reverse transcriptase/retrotransposon-derived protein RNase H-like domain-containing protein n=1 Tax=Cordylochernes scorpioides TaxID=51811 RepID=A0ABY6LDS1_9ARAC|nr:hypothetical protein LAZ67_16002051 [Cordylochernes scorpioides]